MVVQTYSVSACDVLKSAKLSGCRLRWRTPRRPFRRLVLIPSFAAFATLAKVSIVSGTWQKRSLSAPGSTTSRGYDGSTDGGSLDLQGCWPVGPLTSVHFTTSAYSLLGLSGLKHRCISP